MPFSSRGCTELSPSTADADMSFSQAQRFLETFQQHASETPYSVYGFPQ